MKEYLMIVMFGKVKYVSRLLKSGTSLNGNQISGFTSFTAFDYLCIPRYVNLLIRNYK